MLLNWFSSMTSVMPTCGERIISVRIVTGLCVCTLAWALLLSEVGNKMQVGPA